MEQGGRIIITLDENGELGQKTERESVVNAMRFHNATSLAQNRMVMEDVLPGDTNEELMNRAWMYLLGEVGSTKFGQGFAMVIFLLISFIGLAVAGLLFAAMTNIPVEWLWFLNF